MNMNARTNTLLQSLPELFLLLCMDRCELMLLIVYVSCPELCWVHVLMQRLEQVAGMFVSRVCSLPAMPTASTMQTDEDGHILLTWAYAAVEGSA